MAHSKLTNINLPLDDSKPRKKARALRAIRGAQAEAERVHQHVPGCAAGSARRLPLQVFRKAQIHDRAGKTSPIQNRIANEQTKVVEILLEDLQEFFGKED